jgi:hypothetical protein
LRRVWLQTAVWGVAFLLTSRREFALESIALLQQLVKNRYAEGRLRCKGSEDWVDGGEGSAIIAADRTSMIRESRAAPEAIGRASEEARTNSPSPFKGGA